jgi:maltose O-acetyltransferase
MNLSNIPNAAIPSSSRQRLVDTDRTSLKYLLKHGFTKSFFMFFYYAVAIHLPMPGFPGGVLGEWLRVFCAKRLFKYCGHGIRVSSKARFGSGIKVSIGDNSSIAYRAWLLGDISIGNDVMMAPEVTILSASHEYFDFEKPMREQGMRPENPVRICNDVWLGTRVIILPGVTINDHAIIGAGSVVT